MADAPGPGDAPGVPAPGRRAVVVTASDRAAAGTYADRSGPVLVAGLRALGLRVDDPVVVPDGAPVEQALRDAVAAGVALVVTTGGTGLGPRDATPEATLAVLDRRVPGIAEALRADAVRRGVAAGVLSRGVAGVAGRTLVVNVAGSVGAARDALEVLAPVLPHALAQVAGGDHPG
ncbi:MogA/MoaB family molybdenum cofactor biosynthesis protein [Cellulomonas wangsupingiae]|uniref:Molybdopterin-binding protein n=1 Tax=Cellulomonas wangsupingiae TaxID=2968085 RepID=A0ABY5K8Q8_9CELL|nr:molybdenum cofactor synthesis domain-containing protein [Cellulomonas wangsupingiae]MCC2333126.1 MogA/MoaB family molybdenum cofactor biosynthesis protein [Cellulomonas wangsupingiae]UUI66842.1 molybdopterin-binding protein [Cellulomonas wangsupingiae]